MVYILSEGQLSIGDGIGASPTLLCGGPGQLVFATALGKSTGASVVISRCKKLPSVIISVMHKYRTCIEEIPGDLDTRVEETFRGSAP